MSSPQDQSREAQEKTAQQGAAPGERADQWAAGNKQSASPTGQGPAPATPDERTMGMLCHLLSLCGMVIPFGNLLAPLILWLIKRQEMPFVDDQGKESVNFQITVTIVGLLCVPLIFLCGIGAVLLIALSVVDLVFVIIATVKSSSGIAYRYPISFRFIK